MAISKALLSIAGLTAGAAILINLPISLIMSSEKATVQYLQMANLQTIDLVKQNFSASDLWKDNGVVIMAVRRPG